MTQINIADLSRGACLNFARREIVNSFIEKNRDSMFVEEVENPEFNRRMVYNIDRSVVVEVRFLIFDHDVVQMNEIFADEGINASLVVPALIGEFFRRTGKSFLILTIDKDVLNQVEKIPNTSYGQMLTSAGFRYEEFPTSDMTNRLSFKLVPAKEFVWFRWF